MHPTAFIRRNLPGLAFLAVGTLLVNGTLLAGYNLLAPETIKGKVMSVQDSTLILTDAQQQEVRLTVANTAKIQRNGKPAKLSELQTGDAVTATVEIRGNSKVATEIIALAAE